MLPLTTRAPEMDEGLVKFSSVEEMRAYVKAMSDRYAKRVDKYGEEAGELMRTILKRDSERTSQPGRRPEVWHRLGHILMDDSDQLLARNEVTLQLLEESKYKMNGCLDALRSFDELEQFDIRTEDTILLYLKEGIPDRIILEKAPRPEAELKTPTEVPARKEEQKEKRSFFGSFRR